MQTILPRTDLGMDWGAKRRLVAATPDKRKLLFIRPGYSMGAGARGFGQTYYKAALILNARGSMEQHGYTTHLAEGRISRGDLLANREKIDAVFGAGVAAELDLRKTLWVTPAGLVEIA
jgi:hypothetical protein